MRKSQAPKPMPLNAPRLRRPETRGPEQKPLSQVHDDFPPLGIKGKWSVDAEAFGRVTKQVLFPSLLELVQDYHCRFLSQDRPPPKPARAEAYDCWGAMIISLKAAKPPHHTPVKRLTYDFLKSPGYPLASSYRTACRDMAKIFRLCKVPVRHDVFSRSKRHWRLPQHYPAIRFYLKYSDGATR